MDPQIVAIEKRLALLIDADNAPAAKIDLILAEVARYGVANVRRAYGNWKSPHLQAWEQTLHPNAIRPIQQFAYSAGKNASDMALVVDAMDLLHAGSVDAFAVVSSDADFTPLVMRILADGKKVYGFGERHTPTPFTNACSQFTYLEALGRSSPNEPATTRQPTDGKALRGDTRLLEMLRKAVDAASNENGWSPLAEVGNQIANRASFDPRNHGYQKLSDLVAAAGVFEVKRTNLVVMVRRKPPQEPRNTHDATS